LPQTPKCWDYSHAPLYLDCAEYLLKTLFVYNAYCNNAIHKDLKQSNVHQ
jgi:hypothetical protein